MISWRQKSFEVLPALSVRKKELRRSLSLVTAAWGFGIIWMTCISGSWMNSFQRILGFNDLHFGLMQAVPYMAAFANVAAAILIERSGLRKWQFIVCGGASRLLWLAVAAIVLLLAGRPEAIWLVMGVLLVAYSLSALGMPAWFTWMGDLIPRRIRGRYLARRAQRTRVVQFVAAIAMAVLADRAVHADRPFTAAAQPELVWTLAGLFTVAAVFGLIDILLFTRIRELRRTTRDGPRRPAVDIRLGPARWAGLLERPLRVPRYVAAAVRQVLLEPLAGHAFRRYVLYGATVNFAMAVGGPFYMRHMRENLQISHLALDTTFLVLGPILAIVVMNWWGGLVDRWGRRPMLMMATAVAVFGAVPYFFASKYTPNPPLVTEGVNALAGGLGRLLAHVAGWFGASVDWANWRWIPPGAPVGAWMVCSTTIIFGVTGWSGVMLGQQGIILGFSDTEGRSKYVSAFAVLTGLGGAAGGVVGGWLARSLAAAPWFHPIRIGQYIEWNHWHATFAVSILARLAALYVLIGMPDPGARRARDMVRAIGSELYGFMAGWLLLPWRWYGMARRGRGARPPEPKA